MLSLAALVERLKVELGGKTIMVSSLTLKKTIAWVSCLPLTVALIFAIGMKFEATTQVNLAQLYKYLDTSQLICEYVPPDTGKPPEGDGSGSRT